MQGPAEPANLPLDRRDRDHRARTELPPLLRKPANQVPV